MEMIKIILGILAVIFSILAIRYAVQYLKAVIKGS